MLKMITLAEAETKTINGYAHGQTVRVVRSFDPSERTTFVGTVDMMHSDSQFCGVRTGHKTTRFYWDEIRTK